MRFRLLSILGLSIGALACDDDTSTSLMAPARPASGSAAYLVVSSPNAQPGTVVTVTAAVRSAHGVADVGAFTAMLDYDAAGLEYVGEAELAGGMRALNARSEPGKAASITAAGASAEGFGEAGLFAVQFRVLRAGALESLSLRVSELTGVDFGTQLKSLQIRRGLHANVR